MHLRPVTRQDLSRITEIAEVAFLDSEMAQYLNPDRHRYPEAWHRLCSEATRRRFVKPNLCGFVCVNESSTHGGREQILGHAWWQRVGVTEPWPFNDNNTSVSAALERKLFGYEAKYDTFFRLNKAVNHERSKQWNAWHAEDDSLAPLMGKPHWWLDSVAVAPEAQKRGVGSMLVQWGKAQIEKEATARGTALPIILISSPAGNWLYKKQGFKIVVWAGRHFVGKLGFKGGQVFVWDPSQILVRDAPTGTLDAGGKPVDAVWTDEALQAAETPKK